jgi:hypothetical protein
MSMREPWDEGETPDEQEARREAYRRLADAARRVGLSLENRSGMLRQVTHNEVETRKFLADQVYGVPDEYLDDFLRTRMEDAEKGERE